MAESPMRSVGQCNDAISAMSFLYNPTESPRRSICSIQEDDNGSVFDQ